MTPSTPFGQPVRALTLGLLLAGGLTVATCQVLGVAWAVAGVAVVIGLLALAWSLREARQLIGPILRIDLLRTSRHGRLFLFRAAYALALLVVLYVLYVQWFGAETAQPWDLSARPKIRLADLAHFAESFFHAFLLTQLAGVFLFTPAYVAGVVAEEKDCRTLDFLFATDLTDREIIASKLASRLLHLLLFLLTGLPVLMFATFFGGIDPSLLVAGFLSNGLTMLSLAGTSLLCSVYAERTLNALLGAYLVAALHFFFCGLCCYPMGVRGLYYFPLDLTFQAGPIFSILVSTVVHGLVFGRCYGWACQRLRPWYQIWSSAAAKSVTFEGLPPRKAFSVPDENPLLWKERHFAGSFGFSEGTRTFFKYVVLPFAAAGVVVLLLIIIDRSLRDDPSGDPNPGGTLARALVRSVGTCILCFMILFTALRAAYSLSSERDQRTMENLLTIPRENWEILGAKWWASFWFSAKGWWLLAPLWLAGVLTGGLHIVAVPLLLLAGGAYLAFAASLGLWFSLVCQTTIRAVIWTLVVLFAVSAIPPLLGRTPGLLFSPPVTLIAVAYWEDPNPTKTIEAHVAWYLMWAGGGIASFQFGIASSVLWLLTNLRFGTVAGRMPYGARSPAAPR